MLDGSDPKIPRPYKSLLLFLLLACVLVYRNNLHSRPSPFCISDHLHAYLLPVNTLLRTSIPWRKTLTLLGQLVIDFWFLFITVFWIGWIRNSRFPSSVALFYLIRGRFLVKIPVIKEIERFPFPKGIVWVSPGVPSIAVPYDRTRDFFFSGHTGIMTIILSELLATNRTVSPVLCLPCLAYTIFILLSTQVHYTADIFGGFLFAIYIHDLASEYVFYLDWVLSIPGLVGRKLEAMVAAPQARV